jgi:hypothetical protein
LQVTLSNSWGLSTTKSYSYVVIFDSSVGSVTGGGRVAFVEGSPETASFGLVAHYSAGTSSPQGSVEFESRDGGLRFHAVSLDWMIRTGSFTRIAGSGAIDGDGDFGFTVTVMDGGTGPGMDGFRLRIIDKATGTVLYDTRPGSPEFGDSTEPLLQGAIQFH